MIERRALADSTHKWNMDLVPLDSFMIETILINGEGCWFEQIVGVYL